MISNIVPSHDCKMNINVYILGSGEGNQGKNKSLSLQDTAQLLFKNYTSNKISSLL